MTPRVNGKFGVWVAASLLVGSLGLGGCVTRTYVDEQITLVSGRIDVVDRKASDALARADAAAAAAAAAGSEAGRAHQRIDQLEIRVQNLETRPRTPRG